MFSDLLSRLETALGHTRIYNGVAPLDAEMPYVVYRRVTSSHEHHLAAASGITFQQVQIDVYDDGHVTASEQAELVRDGLDGFRGMMGDTAVRMCHLESERDDFIPPTNASPVGRYRISLDLNFALTESVPTFA